MKANTQNIYFLYLCFKFPLISADYDGKSDLKANCEPLNPQVYCKLGHLHLLTQDFAKGTRGEQLSS